jgi:AcrR family transcriptional regulator
LITAATALFGERGYHEVEVKELCERAGLKPRDFEQAFESREELFIAVLAKLNQELQKRTVIAAMAAPREPLGMIEASVRCFLEFLREDPRRGRIMLFDGMSVSPAVMRLILKSAQDQMGMLLSYVSMLFPKHPHVELLSQGLMGGTARIAMEWVAYGFVAPLDEVMLNAMMLYRGVLALAPPAPAPSAK